MLLCISEISCQVQTRYCRTLEIKVKNNINLMKMVTEISCYMINGRSNRSLALCLLVVQTTSTAGWVQQEEGNDVPPVHTFQMLDCRTPVKAQTGLCNELSNISN